MKELKTKHKLTNDIVKTPFLLSIRDTFFVKTIEFSDNLIHKIETIIESKNKKYFYQDQRLKFSFPHLNEDIERIIHESAEKKEQNTD